MGIVVCDLNRLSLLNSTIGRNGGGYPDHLQHESIPLLARIISVVDAYDAMVTDRVYRKGRSKKEACEELKRCAGTQFDPYIVDAFLQIHYPEMASEADAEIAGNRALMSLRRLEPDISPEGIIKKPPSSLRRSAGIFPICPPPLPSPPGLSAPLIARSPFRSFTLPPTTNYMQQSGGKKISSVYGQKRKRLEAGRLPYNKKGLADIRNPLRYLLITE